MVCWLDELFLVDSAWDARWNESKLELALYGTNDRAWHFWEQARLADTRPGTEALSAFFLCVMLGFRRRAERASRSTARLGRKLPAV